MNKRRYPSGVMLSPLVDVERNPLGPEFAAALYESFAADLEVSGVSPRYESANRYSLVAARLSAEIEREVYDSLDNALGVTWR